MFKKEEIGHIILAIIIISFVVSIRRITENSITSNFLAIVAISIPLIILLNIITKKLTAIHYGSNLEVETWKWQRYGYIRGKQFKKAIPVGIIFPFIISILSYGNLIWMASLQSEIQGTSARAAKRHDIYKFTEMTDVHMAIIISSGIVANLLLSILAYIIGLPELGRWSVYYAVFSLIPFGNLDGTKIFFGQKALWFALTVISLIFLSYALLLP